MSTQQETRDFWNDDASIYDRAPQHHPVSAVEWAAWTNAVARLLPAPPARVLDMGAGTGFLSIIAARLGYEVCAVDISSEMLRELQTKATAQDLRIDVVESVADAVPEGNFDVVIERHLIWTLPDPVKTLAIWRSVLPEARLVLFESSWGRAAHLEETLKARARKTLKKIRGVPSDHHGPYPPEVLRSLPFADGTSPDKLIEVVEKSGWKSVRLERLVETEWASRLGLPLPDRLLGVTPRFAIIADV